MAVLMISSCVPLAAVAADEEVNYSSAIAAYKQKMSEAAASKTVYKNMAESYTYYMAAVKYNDGYDTSDANKALAAATETTFAESNKYTGPDKVNELYTKGNSGNLIDSQYYSNLLSRPDISQTDSHQSDDIYFGVSVNGYSFVWLYDGSEMKAPINGYCRVTSGKVGLLDIFRTDGDFEIVNEYWNFKNSSSSDNFYTTNDGTCYTTQVDTGSKGFWPGSQKTDTFGSAVIRYKKQSSGDIFANNSYYTSTSFVFQGEKNYKNWVGKWQKSTIGTSTTGPAYIINYKKVSDAIQNAASTYFANIDSYTESSMITLLQAIDSLTSQKYTFGVQDGDNGAVSEANVQTLANTLSSKVDSLNSAGAGLADRADIAAYLAAFKNAKANFANGNSVDSQNWTYSSRNAFVADYNTYSVIDPYNTVKSSETETVTMPQAVSAQNALSPVANYEAYNAIVEAVKQQDMNAFTESYIKSDSSVYGLIGQYGTSAASITFNNGVANGVTESTSTDGTASTAYVNVNGTVWKNATKTELDHYVGAIETELNSALGDTTGAKRNSYTVTEYTNDVAGTPVNTPKYFGDNFSVAGLDSTVTKIVVNGKEFPATDSFTVRIQSNTDIKVYKTDNASLADKKAVQVQDIYGKSAQAYYLDSNATVVFDVNQFTSGSASYQAQEIGSYAFVKWQVNGKDVASGATMSVSEINTIKPVYKVSTEKTYNVTLDGTAVQAKNTKNIYYDSKVVVKPADGAVAIAAKIGNAYYVVNYGAGEYTFYGCGDVNLYSVMPSGNGYTVNGEKVKEQKPFVWSVKDDNGTKLTTYSTFSNGTKIIEAGTMYYVSETAPSEESFKLGNAGVRSVAAKNPNAESSQYWLGITYGSKKLYTRAYVKYEATVNGTTVQVIDYGNIVSNEK